MHGDACAQGGRSDRRGRVSRECRPDERAERLLQGAGVESSANRPGRHGRSEQSARRRQVDGRVVRGIEEIAEKAEYRPGKRQLGGVGAGIAGEQPASEHKSVRHRRLIQDVEGDPGRRCAEQHQPHDRRAGRGELRDAGRGWTVRDNDDVLAAGGSGGDRPAQACCARLGPRRGVGAGAVGAERQPNVVRACGCRHS